MMTTRTSDSQTQTGSQDRKIRGILLSVAMEANARRATKRGCTVDEQLALNRSEDRKRQKGTLREADADPRLSPLLAFITEVVGPLGAPFWPASSAAAAPADITAGPDDLEEGEIALPLGSDESAQPEAEAPRAAAGATGTDGLLSNVTVSSNSGKTVYWQCTVCSARFRGRQSLADHTLAKKDPPHRRVAEADEFIRSCAETKAARKARDAAADLARVDDLLVQRGHCKTRGEAARLVQAGRVLTRKAAGQPQVLVKAVGLKLAHDAPFSLSDPAASWESEMALVDQGAHRAPRAGCCRRRERSARSC